MLPMTDTFKPLLHEDVTAAAALEPHRFVGRDGNHASTSNPAFGVSQAPHASGNLAALIVMGTAVVELGEDVDAGQAVGPGANGTAVKCGLIGAAGVALRGGSDGDLVRVLLVPRGKTLHTWFERVGAVSATGTVKGPVLPAGTELVAAYVESADALAANDTDNLKIELKKGSTVLARRWTKATDGDGALAADTAALMVLLDRDAGGGRNDLVITEAGTVSVGDVKLTAFYMV